jgi:D-glycero-D-manno-heptose 1,7-bisphosphate phosphatase
VLRCDPVRLFIFDADDTLRRTLIPGQPCPHGPDEWALMPGVRETLSHYDWASGRLRVGIASNQDHIGYGLLRESVARRLLHDMVAEAFGPVRPAAKIELCPRSAGGKEPCWKPRPGMLHAIMAHFRTPPYCTVFIGNSGSDRLAACAAGVAFMWRDDFFGPCGHR